MPLSLLFHFLTVSHVTGSLLPFSLTLSQRSRKIRGDRELDLKKTLLSVNERTNLYTLELVEIFPYIQIGCVLKNFLLIVFKKIEPFQKSFLKALFIYFIIF